MKSYRIELIESRTIFASIKARTKQEAIEKAKQGKGDITKPYSFEIVAIKAGVTGEELQ